MTAHKDHLKSADVAGVVSGKDQQDTIPQADELVAPVSDWTQKIGWRLHYCFPNLVTSPYRQSHRDIRLRDQKQNSDTRVPPDEDLRQRALWGVEIFGPAEIDSLYAALSRLGWDDDILGCDRSPKAWVAEQRMYGSSGALDLGSIHRRGDENQSSFHRQGPIPDGIQHMTGRIYQVSPSITAVVLCFILEKKHSKDYEEALAMDRTTKNESNWRNGGYRTLGVVHIKQQAVEDIRARSRGVVVSWFKAHCAGSFSSSADGNRLPTAELITNLSEPLFSFGQAVGVEEPKWVSLISNSDISSIWTSKDFQGLSFSWDAGKNDNRFHILINLQIGLLKHEHLEYMGGLNEPAHVAFANSHMQSVLMRFAVTAFLRDAIRALRLTRDTLKTESTSHRQVLRALKLIKDFFDKSIGLPIMTAELLKLSETDHVYRGDCDEFLCNSLVPNRPPSKIAEVLRVNTHNLAARAMAQEKETREHLEQISGILGTQESVRVQNTMKYLTYFAVSISVLSLCLALMSIDKFSKFVNLQIDRYFGTK